MEKSHTKAEPIGRETAPNGLLCKYQKKHIYEYMPKTALSKIDRWIASISSRKYLFIGF
jgi:hypothetical protein